MERGKRGIDGEAGREAEIKKGALKRVRRDPSGREEGGEHPAAEPPPPPPPPPLSRCVFGVLRIPETETGKKSLFDVRHLWIPLLYLSDTFVTHLKRRTRNF